MNQLRFDNRVAVVTGAGNGLGREYALLLASRGAKVVVNDLGGGRDGSGKSAAADNVVKQIKDNGGTAVADYNSVVDGEKIIKTALDSFGRVDILINNAGILRDKSFAKMSDQDWDLIHAVHLKGAYKTTQAAWETFRKQKYGRVIMTSSNAGLFGNFGQANYSAAKLGLVGLANTLAIEGAKYNIKANTIVPTAASRLPPDLFKAMQPALIAPVVVYMCHESFTETGNIIDSTLGYAVKTHLVRSKGTALREHPTDPVTIESVKDQWPEVTDMSTANHEENITNVLPNLVAKLREFEERFKLSDGKDSFWSTFRYTAKDLSLYALGVGATTAAESELKFLYESHENFTALPSYFMLAGMSWLSPVVQQTMRKHGKHADFTNILHVEQYIEFPNTFPGTEGEYATHTYVADLLDKGSSAIVIVNTDIYHNKELFYRTQEQIFVLGQGGFGGPRSSKHATEVVPVPKRTPDAIVEQKTSADQAALYRLSGDWNPLHIDPSVSGVMGHKQPLLHGLATLGFAARHVLAKYGGNDPATFKAMKARFVKPVFPGQTIVTEIWLEGNRVCFQAKTKETGNIVISGAYVDMRKVVSSATASVAKL